MKYIVLLRKNPQNLSEEKYYMNAKILGTVGLSDICSEISLSSSLTRGDVTNTIMSFLDTIPKYLKMGYSVKLDELGTFRLSLKSKASDTPEEVNASKVKSIRPVFVASTKLKAELQDTKVEQFPEA